MKQTLAFLSVFILTSIIACDPPVMFSEPQPASVENLANFPGRLQGQYLSLKDNSTLTISDKLIQRIYDYDFRVHKNELDSSLRLSGDTIINLESNEKTLVKRVGDSLLTHIHYVDTLFLLNADNVVRKFKGYYFLNTSYGQDGWEVKKVELSKGQLTISSISAKNELENLKSITESANDTIPPYTFSATKKQFKKFVKNEGFTDSERFVKGVTGDR